MQPIPPPPFGNLSQNYMFMSSSSSSGSPNDSGSGHQQQPTYHTVSQYSNFPTGAYQYQSQSNSNPPTNVFHSASNPPQAHPAVGITHFGPYQTPNSYAYGQSHAYPGGSQQSFISMSGIPQHPTAAAPNYNYVPNINDDEKYARMLQEEENRRY
ncbi:unnamed protein product [Didymodactylos carnosus]|uniref:Uncharacterized protein n=1 Tax=Didymodactylos carnosus TaxID=1234261 RepID=A0A814TCP6_9BILA|nr:unnamed protein product [Didymodactylos carnosus]CAF1341526.1 unnamed protein product [Didymodactylos carnosus]CAF3923816.1 unnamed protein product [Didymodactylos carnosus]CAF4152668.1 unnamed protein product [Didymodactylos carnosus]